MPPSLLPFLRTSGCRFGPGQFPRLPCRHATSSSYQSPRLRRPHPWYLAGAALSASVLWTISDSDASPKHAAIAAQRCVRIGDAVVISMIDYKRTFMRTFTSELERKEAVSHCHTRSARRVLKALLKNGGIYIKLGQHVSSLAIIPREWAETFRPLQDNCEPTAYEDVVRLLELEMGRNLQDLFEYFEPRPIGVASLAQVHVAKYLGREVAVKLQHPALDEFTKIDIKTVGILVDWVKYWFPEFEFSWLAEEMRENLPKEMNFTFEAANAVRTVENFENVKTSLYIPEVYFSSKRVLIMEYIRGGRVDDKLYIANHDIDRNKVSVELQRIFSQMVHIHGWFHADPHPGNLLIRPSPKGSRSPYNFEIVLLDHGLYFDMDTELRTNYSRMWLSLISRDSPSVRAARRKYAALVGNIGPDLYPVFETAMTGRLGFEGTWDDSTPGGVSRATNMIELTSQTDEERALIIDAVMNRGGIIEAVFEMLRRLPRRILMVLKLNDLTRNLDHSLDTTHPESRIFLILARYCSLAVWRDDRQQFLSRFRSGQESRPSLLVKLGRAYWDYQVTWNGFRLVEFWMDFIASTVKAKAWLQAFAVSGFRHAHLAAAGLNTQEIQRANNIAGLPE